ncbi:MAG: T9SS type A sorting domain-containing protein, partial [bacterium]
AYGNILGGDRSHPNEITYIFPGKAGHFYLSYQAYDIDTNDEVKILLNGAKITNVLPTSNNAWSGNRGAVLRDGLVNNTSANLLVFDNTKNPPGALLWGVRQVSIENCFKLPSTMAYGKIPGGNQAYADRVIYWFPGQSGEVNLFYEVYDIDDSNELDIIFNGTKIRDEAVTVNNGWSTIRTLLLPEVLVNDTEANIVIFDNVKNPPNALNWGVRNVSIGLASANAPAINATEETVSPASFYLAQNFPNPYGRLPFNPSTTIRFSTPSAGKVKLTVYNLHGEVVRTLVNGEMAAGNHLASFDGSDLASGVYFYRLEAGELTAIQKMILAK